MIYKRLKISKILKMATIVTLFSCMGANSSHALEVSPVYELEGIEAGYVDKDIPIALKVTTGGDGISKGAYLYRHKHQGVDYYAPWVPKAWVGTKADKNGTAYNTWGLWDMTVNKTGHTITTTYYYPKGVVKSGGAKGVNSAGSSAGTLPANTEFKIYGISDATTNTSAKVYVNAIEHSQHLSQGSSASELIQLSADNVTFKGTKLNLVYSGWSDDLLLQNFKAYAKYSDNARSTHFGVVKAKWVNPDRTDVPASVRGKNGEWRYIGYNRYGDPLDNPYFIADTQSCNSTHIYGAPRRHTPWDKSDKQTGESDPATAYNVFIKGMSSAGLGFEYDKQTQFSAMKDYVVDLLYAQGCIKTKSNVKNEFSLRTNAYKQGIILKNQRKKEVYYGVPFVQADNIRDLYVSRMEIWDLHDNALVASLTNNGTSSKVATSGTYIPGRAYEVRVRLANNTNSALIKNSVETQFGMVYGAGSIDSAMTYVNTKSNKQSQTQGNKAGIAAKKGDESNNFVFKFQVSSNETKAIDIYGFVGSSHTGVDNIEYGNDTMGIRLTKSSTPPTPSTDSSCNITNNGKTKVCGNGDIRPYNIQIFDYNGSQIYRHMYNESTPRIKEGLIPGQKYEIVYNAIYYGDSIMEYTWKDAVNDNPNTSANEYVPGSWSAGTLKKHKIPFDFAINRYAGKPTQVDSIVSNAKKNFYVYEQAGTPNYGKLISTDITLTDGTLMTFKDSYMVFQYPYLNTSFRVASTDKRINSNTNNDRMEITIDDDFDIKITSLDANPSVTYTNGNQTKTNYHISYDVALKTPSYVTKDNYTTSISTAISINGQTYNVKDQLMVGANTGLTHVIENVTIPPSGDISIAVNVNFDKLSYESGDYNNNKMATSTEAFVVKDPGSGGVNDTVQPEDTTENNSSSTAKGGDANNNCLVPRTTNSWTSVHRKLTWSSTPVTYNTFASGESVTFNKYKVDYYNESEATETYTETFDITQILFRSKETTDNKRGSNGWVDLLKPSEAQYAEIKAGYGFELKIVTKYNTNATSKRTWSISNNGSSGTDISYLNGAHNYGMEEVFLELPGTGGANGTRKILSSTGYGSSIKGLNVARVGTGDSITWTYSIKPSNTLGIGETPKIYIPQGMKNGDYKLKIYTTPLQGVGTEKKPAYRALCDRKEVTIKVKGSATDDLGSNIIQ